MTATRSTASRRWSSPSTASSWQVAATPPAPGEAERSAWGSEAGGSRWCTGGSAGGGGWGAVRGASGHALLPSGRPACPPLAAPSRVSREQALAVVGPALPIPMRVATHFTGGFGGPGTIDDITSVPGAEVRLPFDPNERRRLWRLLRRLEGALIVRSGAFTFGRLYPRVLHRLLRR